MAYVDSVNLAPDANELLTTLAKANNFTMAELADNRNGKISNAQMTKLTFKALRPVLHAGKALIGWLMFVIIVRTFVPDFVIWITSMYLGNNIFALFAAITTSCVIALLVGIFKSGKRIVALIGDA